MGAGGLASLLSELEARPEVDIVQGLIQRLVLEPGNANGAGHFPSVRRSVPVYQPRQRLYRRSVFDRVGRFDEGLRDNEDTDWFLQLGVGRPQAGSARPMLLYRLHDRNLVHSQNLIAGGMLRMVKRHIDRVRRREEEGEKGRRGEGEEGRRGEGEIESPTSDWPPFLPLPFLPFFF